MGYVLAIDLGTTYTSAAVSNDGRSEVVQLGSRAATIPTIVLLRADGEVITGETAERRSVAEPERTAREFKRRLGDSTPMILGTTPYGAETLFGLMLNSVSESVARLQGAEPDLVVVTHPASYGPFKLDLLRQAVRVAGIRRVEFLSEPQAAAIHYASLERVEDGAVLGVYDFGGGTFDAAVVRKTAQGFELLGEPEGIERLGGIDFDDALLAHVDKAAGRPIAQLDSGDPGTRSALARLRDECRNAKETLSSDTDCLVPMLLPSGHQDIRVTREEFEEMVRPRLKETVAVLERSVRSAGLSMDALDRILLVGGSSRIPLVGATVEELTGRQTAVDSHPKHTIALGAATYGAQQLAALSVPAPPVPGTQAEAPASAEPATASSAPEPVAPRVTPPSPPLESASGGGGRRPFWLAGAAVAVIAAVGALAAFTLGGDDDEGERAAPEPTATATARAQPENSPTSVAAASTPPTATATPPPANISAIRVAGERYEVDFATRGFQPALPGQHVHFFFDTVIPLEAGVPGSGPWFVYGGSSPFTGYALSDKPAGAQRMCILVANPDHSVQHGTGNCVELPR